MQHYEGRFPDGHVIRKRAMRPYCFGWRVFYRINGSLQFLTGFTVTQERAEEAIAAHARTMSKRSVAALSCRQKSRRPVRWQQKRPQTSLPDPASRD